jgi:ZIP family zinc transporter
LNPIFVIVLISVLGPVVGSALGILRRPSVPYVCNMICFAAGVMLAISFLELIPESIEVSSIPIALIGIVMGSLAMYGLDRMIPHIHPRLCTQEQGCNLHRTATYLIFGIFLHNFPEGMAIAIGTVTDIKVSVAIAIAIAVHNIPEGICTSAPYYHSTGKKLRAFLVSSSTAIPILLGFIAARYIFQSIPEHVIGLIVAATAGLMIYITTDELIPSSCVGKNHMTIFWLIAGVVFVVALGMI